MELICHINASESECMKGAERGKRIENRGRKAKKKEKKNRYHSCMEGRPTSI